MADSLSHSFFMRGYEEKPEDFPALMSVCVDVIQNVPFMKRLMNVTIIPLVQGSPTPK